MVNVIFIEQDESYQGKYRICPNCGALSERLGGYNAITCLQCSFKWRWNLGRPKDGEQVPHDSEKAAMHEDYEQILKDKGFLKKFHVLESSKTE